MINLLKETKEILKDNGKTIEDIKWIGNSKYYVDINKFVEIANVEYDDDFGSPKVAEDLKVVGNDWWLERHEYDGSEWWEYKSIPIVPDKKIELKALTIDQAKKLGFHVSCGWENLAKINDIKEVK